MKDCVLLFDLGGVIEKHNFIGFSKYIYNKYRISPILFHETLLENLRLNDKNAITDKKLIENLNKLGLRYTLKTFYKDYFKFISLNKYILHYIKNELKDKYRLAIFSNCRKIHIYRSIKKYHYDKIFDKIFISQNFNTRKPELKYYKLILNKLKVKPKQCIFIDDKERNMSPAKILGINCIIYTNLKSLKEQLANIKY